jgi:hypothetical protein
MFDRADGEVRKPRAAADNITMIPALFLLGAAALVLQVAVHWVFYAVVLLVSFAIVRLSIARWPPSQEARDAAPTGFVRPTLGLPIAMLGTFLAFLGGIALIAEVTDSKGVAYALGAVLVFVSVASWLALRGLYTGHHAVRRVRTDPPPP